MITVSPAPWETEFSRRNVTLYPFDSLLGFGLLSTGASRSVAAPKCILSTGVGSNKIAETVEDVNVSYATDDGKDMWQYPMNVSVIAGLTLPTNPVSSESGGGLEIGSLNVATDPASPAYGIIRLFYDGLNNCWKIRTAKGDGTPYTDTMLNMVDVPTGSGVGLRIRLIYVPGQYVTGIVNGVIGGTVTNPALFPDANSPLFNRRGVGVFVRTSNNGTDYSSGVFSLLNVERIGKK